MVRLILGRSGSGKSAYIMSEIRERVKKEQPNALLIVPEQYSHAKEREICFAAGDTASRFAEVFSFKSLSARILWTEGGLARPMLDAGGRLLTLRLAVNAVITQLRVYAPVAARTDFLEKLSRMIEEFIRYCITPEALTKTADSLPEGNCKAKLKDLALLYGAYEALVANGAADPQSLLTFAAKRLQNSGFFADKEIYLDGFSGFTPQEREILQAMITGARRVTVCLCAPCDETPFEGPDATAKGIVRFCKTNGVDVQKVFLSENYRSKNEPLRKLEADFFARGAESFTEPAENIRVYFAKNRRSECMAVAAEIRRLCTGEDYRYRDIAVMNGAEEAYDGILSGVFEEYGIPYFSDLTRKMTDQPIYRLLSAALEVSERRFDTDAVISCLRCSLSGFSDGDCDLLESYARTWKIPGRRWLSDKNWEESPEGLCHEVNEEEKKKLAYINKLKRIAVAPLKKLDGAIRRGGTAKELCTALYTYTNEIGLPHTVGEEQKELTKEGKEREATELAAQYTVFCNALDQIVRAGQDEFFTQKEFSDAVRLVLGCARVGSIPDSLDSVSAGQMGRMRISAPRAVFILGVNEGLVPAAPAENGLLSEDERQIILSARESLRLAPSGIEAAEAEEFVLYTALTAPSERLYLFVPEADDMGAALRPSYVPDRVCELFSGLQPATCDDTDSRTRSLRGLLELAAENRGETGRLCREVLLKRGKGELLDRLRTVTLPDESVSEAKNKALYGEILSLSPSRIERYAGCRFRYFAETGLRAKEPPVAELRPAESGTFIHYVLENVAKTVKKETDWAQADPVYLRRLTGQFAERFLSSPEGIPPEARTPRMNYYIRRIVNDTEQIVLRMHEEFSKSSFRPEIFEADLGENGGITLHINDREIRLKGRVDRVDTWKNDGKTYLRVVDYKSGEKKMNYTDIEAGLAVQMLLYLFVLTDREGAIPAGVLYAKASFPRVNAERGLSDEKYEEERSREQCPTGLILKDEEVLSAMERCEAGEKPLFIPVPKKKTENDSLVTPEQFGKLRRHIEKLLEKITAELQAGLVTPNPYSKAERKTACGNCPYRAVCRFDATVSGNQINYLKKMNKKDFFGEEDDHAGVDSESKDSD